MSRFVGRGAMTQLCVTCRLARDCRCSIPDGIRSHPKAIQSRNSSMLASFRCFQGAVMPFFVDAKGNRISGQTVSSKAGESIRGPFFRRMGRRCQSKR